MFLLNISNKLSIKQWQTRGKDAKDSVTFTKKLYYQMGLVDDQTEHSCGNNNEIISPGTFFGNIAKVVEITGLDKRIISCFSTVLSFLSCGHYIKVDQFKNYCFEEAKMTIEVFTNDCYSTQKTYSWGRQY